MCSCTRPKGQQLQIYFVHHAQAVKRSEWEGEPRLRPLSPRGRRQAQRIEELLLRKPLARMLASPYFCCRQTLERLSRATSVPLEAEERLAEEERVGAALELVWRLGMRPAAICSHGDLIRAMLRRLEKKGMRIEEELRCEEGSVWLIEGAGHLPERAACILAGGKADEADDERVAEHTGGAGRSDEVSRLAVLDLGSTSFHLLVADVGRDGTIVPHVRERVMLHLGAALGADGFISEEVCDQAVAVVRMMREVAIREHATRLVPVATAALRDASNGNELKDALSEAIGEPVRLLRGEEEARTIFNACFHRLPSAAVEGKTGAARLGLDLGGGSLELALGLGGQVLWEKTLRLGATRLWREFVRGDRMTKLERSSIRDRVHAELAGLDRPAESQSVTRCVAMGGTARALAELAAVRAGAEDAEDINGFFLGLGELKQLRRELVHATLAERIETPGLSRRRADLLPTGAVILEAVARELGLEGFVICDWGVREGTLLEEVGITSWA